MLVASAGEEEGDEEAEDVGAAHHLLPWHRVALTAHGRVHQVHHAPLLLVTEGRGTRREVGGGGHNPHLATPKTSPRPEKFSAIGSTSSVTRPAAGQLLTTVAESRANACATFPAPPGDHLPVGSPTAGADLIGRRTGDRVVTSFPLPRQQQLTPRGVLGRREAARRRQNLFLLALNIHQLVPELIS